MLSKLKTTALDYGFDLKPEKVMVDFEQSAINSLKRIFKYLVKGKYKNF
jgi:hypothetical protein